MIEKKSPPLCMLFAENLISWYAENARDLPWRASKDPYVIWLSEIILQQTRVEQGIPYFYSFIEAYPNVTKFAKAPEEDILRMWQGLGYYSRARNMHKAAKVVVEELGSVFPSAYMDLIKLPGIGEYTAAAVSSFSINEAKAVVDGNVYRVLSRYLGIEEPINSTKGKRIFAKVAYELLDKDNADLYNQAIMDFGALQCKPKNPLCNTCVFRLTCVALRDESISRLPVKLKGKPSRNRYFHYFLIFSDNKLLMSRRGEGDVWTNLYEFPMIETNQDYSVNELQGAQLFDSLFKRDVKLQLIGKPIKHVLSHQNIYARFYLVDNESSLKDLKNNWDYVLLEKLDSLAKHKLIFSFLEENKQLINSKF